MQVTLNDSFDLEAPRAVVWGLLSDPYAIVPCVRGAQITEQTGERSYRGAVTMKIGPVTTGFSGDIDITTMDEAAGQLELKGQGRGAMGRGKASMDLAGTLTGKSANETQVDFTLTLSISGKLAQFGSRLIVDVSKRVLAQFVDCFRLRVKAVVDSAAAED